MTIGTRLSWDGGLGIDTDSAGGDFQPVIDPGPTVTAPSYANIAALVVDDVTSSGVQRVPSVRLVTRQRTRYRIRVGGKDITFFRGLRTPMPTYSLIEPLLYGSGQLYIPQINAVYERAGSGDLHWLKKWARVFVDRLDDDGNLIATDYRSFISDDPAEGRDNRYTLGGEATGAAAMQDRETPITLRSTDIGRQVMLTMRNRVRVPIAGVPTTGIKVPTAGGMGQLDWITETLAKSTTKDGKQWTVMPNSSGKYHMFQKDTTTIDATVYIDGYRVQESLRRDYTEEPNRIWVTAVGPDGMRIRYAIYPGLAVGARPAFPGNVSPGDTGDAVLAVIWRLWYVGRLSPIPDGEEWTTAGDDPVTAAVKGLQRDSDLTVTGVVNEATWNVLHDPQASGFALTGSRVLPAAENDNVKPYLRTASGQIRKRNPKYDRTIPWVDITADMGVIDSPAQGRDWGNAELADENTANWVGTITLTTGAYIDGEHNPGDALIWSQVKDGRIMKPGMNVWVPNWDGGTLFHVSGVDVSADSVVLTVDTRARDAMKVWEVISRNRESRARPSRQWIAVNRRSGTREDTGAFYDGRSFGKIPRTFCPAGTWTTIGVPAGRSGMLQKVTVSFEDPVEFAIELWDRARDTSWLDRHVGDWNTDSFWAHFNDRINDWKENRGLIDHWGNVDQPAGYGHAAKTGPDLEATGAVVTGDFHFEAGAPYFTHGEPILTLAVRPLADTHIKGGRVLYLLLDDAAS